MKSIIKNIIYVLINIASKLYPYSLNVRIRNIRDKIYTIWIRNFIGIVGEDCTFAKPVFLQGGGQRSIRIGNNTRICVIGDYCHITAINKISIGDGFLSGRYVYIGDNSHGGLSWEEANIPPVRRILSTKGEVCIGNNVWLGDKVAILAGVHIGNNVIIGANSVVTHNIPSNCIAAGVPAKIIKKLN